MKELKLCPFCGEEARVEKINLGKEELFRVICPECLTATHLREEEKNAVAEWNARPIEDAQDDKNKILQKKLAEARKERERLRALLRSCCNEFVPLDKKTSPNYPVCYRNRLIVDKGRHCTARGECPIYAELTKFDGSKDKPDGRLVELPNLKKAMAEIGDEDGKFSYPPLFPKK